MVEDYNLKQSVRSIKHLYPVLLSKDKTIIDGRHRLKEDNKWPRLKLDHIDTLKKFRIAQLASNFQRRRMPSKELRFILNSLAGEYRSEHPKGSLTELIARETGISLPTIRKYLKDEYKEMSHDTSRTDLRCLKRKVDDEPPHENKITVVDCECLACKGNIRVYCDGQGKHRIERR